MMDWDKYDHTVALREAGEAQEAILELQSLAGTSSDPEENALVLLAIANCHRQLGALSEAQFYLDKARSLLTPSCQLYPRVLLVEALLHEAKGDWSGELERLESISRKFATALRTEDNSDLRGEISRHKGIALLGLGSYSKAQPLLEAGILDDYEKPVTLYFLGQCYYQQGDLQRAKARIREALQIGLHPKHELMAHYRLAVIHLQSREYAWSKQEFEWCLAHLPPDAIDRSEIEKGLATAERALQARG